MYLDGFVFIYFRDEYLRIFSGSVFYVVPTFPVKNGKQTFIKIIKSILLYIISLIKPYFFGCIYSGNL